MRRWRGCLKSASARCNNQSGMRRAFLVPLLAVTLAFVAATPMAGQSPRRNDSDALKQEPKQTRRLYEVALRLEKEGKTAAAIAAFGDLLQEAPAHLNGLRHRAQLLLETGKPEEASHDLSAALVSHPEDGETWEAYGDCLRALQRDTDAASAYRKAMENGLNTSAVNRKRGDALSASGEQEAALESYSVAIKLRLDDPESYLARGILLLKMKRERDAIDDFTRAIDFKPDYAFAYFRRGQAWGDLRQFDNAVRDLTVFLRLKPGDGQALAYRGAAYDTLGRVEEALVDYGDALKADPTNAHVLMARGELYTRLGRHVDALADRDRAIVLEPANAYLYMARGGTQLALGNGEKAIADRTRAVELAPSNAIMWYTRATTYAALGQNEKALNDAAQALRLKPDFEAAWKLIDGIEASTKLMSPASLPEHPQPGASARPQTAKKSTGAKSHTAPRSSPVIASPQKPTAVVTPTTGRREIVGSSTSGQTQPPQIAKASDAKPKTAPQSSGPKEIPMPPSPALQPRIEQATRPAPETVHPAPVLSAKAAEPAASPSKPTSQQMYRDGRALLQNGKFAEASAKLEQAAALDPANPLVWNALGFSRMKQKRYQEALTALDKAIEIDPRYKNAYENRSAVKQWLGDGSGSARDRIKAQLIEKHK